MPATASDWNPEAYARFRGLRLRPALDLLAQVGDLPPGDVVDLGCGDGAAAGALKARWPDRALVGVDRSAAMLAGAAKLDTYERLIEADAAAWAPEAAPALIFSNAALQWLPGHDALLPRLAGFLAPGSWLAVQMPRQFTAPSHRFLRDIAAAMFPGRFDDTDPLTRVQPAESYWQMLAPFGEVSAWETDYIQQLDPSPGAHPVRRFTESTAMRPYVDRMDPGEATAFIRAYEEALSVAYPLLPDGAVLFPFRRAFFTLCR